MTTCTRMFWPVTSGAWGTPHTVNGRTYVTGPGVFDALSQDVAGLVSAGAVSLMQSGAVPASTLTDPQGNKVEGLPAAGVALSEIQGQIQGSAIAAVPDIPAPDPSRPVPVTLATSAGTPTTSSTLAFAAVAAGVVPGMLAKDNTTPSAISTQTVQSVTAATVVLSANVGAAVGNGDSITFTPAVGTLYMDVALNKAIFWDGLEWRDCWNGQAA